MERPRWGPLRDLPPNPPLTIALLVLWAILAIYVVVTRNTLGYFILALVALFVFLPALVVWLGRRNAPGEEQPGEGEPPLVEGRDANMHETDDGV